MPVHLNQLVYTSFSGLGFRTLASSQVPMEIQEAFIEQVVYKHWEPYKIQRSGYRAAYLHQVTPEHTLFGWLYNDGPDDLGRSNVPYFVCYYYAQPLHAVHLENIFVCLQRGPVALIDRQSLPATLKTIVAPDLWSYQPARIGVAIPSVVREHSHIALKQRRSLDLFVPVDEPEMVTSVNSQIEKQQEAPLQLLVTATPITKASPSQQDTIPVFQGNRPEPQVDSYTSDASAPTSPNKSVLLIGMGIGFVSSLALIGTVYGLLQWQNRTYVAVGEGLEREEFIKPSLTQQGANAIGD